MAPLGSEDDVVAANQPGLDRLQHSAHWSAEEKTGAADHDAGRDAKERQEDELEARDRGAAGGNAADTVPDCEGSAG